MPAAARQKIRTYQKARERAKRRLVSHPEKAPAWKNLADALFGLKRYREAIACYDKVLIGAPDNRTVWQMRGAALRAIGKDQSLDFAVTPHDADSWTVRAGELWYLDRFAEAVEACDRALSFDPGNSKAKRIAIRSRLHSCDWRRREEDKRDVSEGLKAGKQLIRDIGHLALSDSASELRLGTQLSAAVIPPAAEPLWQAERYRHDRIRIAYISADLHSHATAHLMAGVFERHDKSRFETAAISLGPDDRSEMRTRLRGAFHRFADVRARSDVEVARLLRALEIDIAVDLKGYTGSARTEILAYRPAPVQVNYLGYPGTMDLPFIDYIIADPTVLPYEHRDRFAEKIAYLPHCYQPNDSKRFLPAGRPSRSEAGLPETGFVFTCFNNNFKLGPEMFEIWMRLLRDVEGSVLWLLEDNASAACSLTREAAMRGVAADRLIFAPRRPLAEHLARQTLGDLFLDTLPYGAHTTASDALWVGLPVLTCMGKTFAGRVAASALFAIGLPELVTSSLADYESVARSLAQNPEGLAAIRAKLLRNRDTTPLFDTAGITHDLESAYTVMWEQAQRGELPTSFSVVAARH